MQTQLTTTSKTGKIQLSSIEVIDSYLKEWNETSKDFKLISIDGEPLRNTLYRVGGVHPNVGSTIGNGYCILLKYVEDQYPEKFLKEYNIKGDGKHLKSVAVIINEKGEEVKEFDSRLDYPYLKGNSPFYSYKGKLYNAELDVCYGEDRNMIESGEFFFINSEGTTLIQGNRMYSGVLKISKKDGSVEIFK